MVLHQPHEELDRALTKFVDIERSVDGITATVSDAELKTIIKDREFSKVRVRFDSVDQALQIAKEGFENIDAVLKEAYKASGLS